MATANAPSTDPNSLGSKPIGKLLVQYSIPAVIAAVATSLYNIIDSIFIGRGVGAMAISGLAITFPLMNLVVAFCTLIAVGGATISSISLGQKNVRKATDVVNNVFVMCLIHAVVVGGLTLLFLDDILYFFGATANTIKYAREFMAIILYGTPISYVFIGLNNIMRATGYPTKAMVSALISVVVNIVLAPIFIFVLEWGIAGAALATIGGQLVAFVWVLWHFMSRSSYVHLNTANKWLSWKIIKPVYAIGLSPFLMNVCACIVVIFINRALLTYTDGMGDMAVGAYGIINRATMFFVMIVFGVTQGMQPILGYNYGAARWDRVRRTLGIGIWLGVGITTPGWVLVECFPDMVSGLFTVEPQLIEICRIGARIYFMFYPLVGAQIIIQNFFQSIGKPQLSIFLSLTRQLIFLLPPLLILPRYIGITGVWWANAISDFSAFALAIIILIVMMRKTTRHFNQITPDNR